MTGQLAWRERLAGSLVTPEEAVGVVKPGDKVWAGMWTSMPLTLCRALAARAGELNNVNVYTSLTVFDWDAAAVSPSFRVQTAHVGAPDRKAVQQGRFDYIPFAQVRAHEMPPGLDQDYDVALIPVSPPDAHGFCSFGPSVWVGPAVVGRSKVLVGEVHPEFIRTGGNNFIEASRFALLCEAEPAPPPPVQPRGEETVYAAEVICTLVASEIVRDGCTLQMGVGDVSAALAVYLHDKHDLGVHTEIIPGGVADLVREGVVTGKHKTFHPGKVVGTAFVQMPREELEYIDGHPMFELYDFGYVDDLGNLLRVENLVAVNNALAVDITGNVCSETMGAAIFTGPGGQYVFATAASLTSGGSVIVLPSSQLVGGTRVSRIRATLEPGSTITVHRAYVDYVVTEHGIARLRGKTLRQRIAELISVAHPDFRAELRHEAGRLHGIRV